VNEKLSEVWFNLKKPDFIKHENSREIFRIKERAKLNPKIKIYIKILSKHLCKKEKWKPNSTIVFVKAAIVPITVIVRRTVAKDVAQNVPVKRGRNLMM